MKRGFTLLELLIVIVVIGILAGIALPQFTKTKEHALGKEAQANLKLIAAAEKIYKMEMNTYYPSTGTVDAISDINTNLKLSLPSGATRNWDYQIVANPGAGPGVYAFRQGSGGYLDCQYVILVGFTLEEPVSNGSAYCP